MGVKKKSSKKSAKGGIASRVKSAIGGKLGLTKKGGGGRRRRQTPERLARQILVWKLKKKLYRLKYGGR